jgi:hypothetical protein
VSSLVERWQEQLADSGFAALPESLDQFPELRDATVPDGYELVDAEGFVQFEDGVLGAQLTARIAAPDTDTLGAVDVDLDTESREMRIDTLDMPEDRCGGRLGRLVLAKLAVLGQDLGLEAIVLEAGKVGRWAWLRCGFDFDGDEERHRVIDAAREFAQRLGCDVDLSAIRHSWDFVELPGTIPAQAIRDAGGPVIFPTDAMVPRGKALILGPNQASNTWLGRLDLDPRSPGFIRLHSYVFGDVDHSRA